MEEEKSSDDVIVEESPETSQPEATGEAQPAEPTGDVIAEEPVEQKDDVWKNRAFELERKLGNLTNELPKIIEETLVKTNKKPEEAKYTVSQLEQYAQEHPEHRPWVEEQKLKILEENLSSKFEDRRNQDKAELVRQQTFQSVVNDPKFSDAFILNHMGQKVFNPQSPMAIAMDAYLRDPDVARRQDAWAVAAKLARADVMDMQIGKKDLKLTTLKRQNAQLKQKTLVEGDSVKNVRPVKDSFTEAQERLSRTGTRKDAQVAVAAYLDRIAGEK